LSWRPRNWLIWLNCETQQATGGGDTHAILDRLTKRAGASLAFFVALHRLPQPTGCIEGGLEKEMPKCPAAKSSAWAAISGADRRYGRVRKKSRTKFSLNCLNGARSKPGLPIPQHQRIDPELKTLAPAGDSK
jgi:hypothetical protein